MQKIISFFLAIVMYLLPQLNIPKAEIDPEKFQSNYTNVFVHGLGGWGEASMQNKVFPYWGTFGGDLMIYLRARGYSCVATDVTPGGSVWDRACELYAQLTGTRTDYGVEHSARCKHERFGEDFTGKARLQSFDAEHKINLYGHSFGGATILEFLQLLYAGSEVERNATPEAELSDFFKGGKGDYVHAIVTLSAPMNGTSAYCVREEIEADPNATLEEKAVIFMLVNGTAAPKDGRIPEDSAEYDMYIDNALQLCESFETLKDVYYFSVPCQKMIENEDGSLTPNVKEMEPLFRAASKRMVKYTGVTKGGYVVDESWQMNDGLVNTKSARAPFNAPQQDLDRSHVESGIWNVLPTYDGDHMSLMGGLLIRNNVREVYLDLLDLVNAQP